MRLRALKEIGCRRSCCMVGLEFGALYRDLIGFNARKAGDSLDQSIRNQTRSLKQQLTHRDAKWTFSYLELSYSAVSCASHRITYFVIRNETSVVVGTP